MWIDEPLDGNLATVEPNYAVPPEIRAIPLPNARDENAASQ
jgi:hypothetical protein